MNTQQLQKFIHKSLILKNDFDEEYNQYKKINKLYRLYRYIVTHIHIWNKYRGYRDKLRFQSIQLIYELDEFINNRPITRYFEQQTNYYRLRDLLISMSL